MQRERVTDHVFVFTSSLYVHVTASLILTSEGAILIDTLLYPEETLQLRQFVRDRLNAEVRYVINTHYHADHTLGTCFFDQAEVVAHRRCYELLDTRGRESLLRMQQSSSDMMQLSIVLPHTVFEDCLTLYLGGKTLHLKHSPGHSDDSIVVYLEEDQILFAADTVMPLPHFVDGCFEALVASLEQLQGRPYENIVQGHGDIILRGEVESKLREDLAYLTKLDQAVRRALEASPTTAKLQKALEMIKVEACGKSRILLNGAAQQLHRSNVYALAAQRRRELNATQQPQEGSY
jgi:glyoxylase-like metal-dependent hydrolase (beta-lactamase superfamily II)